MEAEKLAQIAARMRAIGNEGGRTMWHLVLADLMLEMLKERSSLSAPDLRARLRERMDSTDEALLKDAYLECIEQLAARTIKA